MTASGDLTGWRVLIPRGGAWGDEVAASLRLHGAEPVIAPMIEFLPPHEPESLSAALDRLEAGGFDWLVVTSATTVAELSRRQVALPKNTRVAAVGDTTAARLAAAGYRVDFVPATDHSARGLVAGWPQPTRPNAGSPDAGPPDIPSRILIPQSDLAGPSLANGLRSLGLHVETVTAYRNVPVPVTEQTVSDVGAGRIHALLVTSGSVARQVRDQFGPVPMSTCVACIGEFTTNDARAAGLRVDVVADERTGASLVDSLAEYARADKPTEAPTTVTHHTKENHHS
ncbi:uroporphyrinogen-III synthase [Homoserinimonas sp. OAct 916]|uniref:uroporphyrinogen-III synthase n=1 Tax=Homoserinimonas sp. OAct 916 TaxID=2211450 RepID=UPI000DBE2D0D|nr:uroporphyrinogen-III synthase [Homoserinimonas sp. OAct 916]